MTYGNFGFIGVVLGGVIGGVIAIGGEFFLEWIKEWRACRRAKRLVCGELLQASLILRSLIDMPSGNWVSFPDPEKVMQTSAWQEHRAYLSRTVNEDLWNTLVITYAEIELERARLVLARDVSPGTPMTDPVIGQLSKFVAKVERVRARLGCGGGWADLRGVERPGEQVTQGSYKDV